MRSTFSLLLLALVACNGSTDGGKDDTGDTDDTGTDGGLTFEDFVYVQETWVGDTSCFDGTNWGLGQSVDPSCVQDASVSTSVRDFQNDTVVYDATVNIWYGDDLGASPDVTVTVDDSGNFSATVPTCTPTAYKTSTPPEYEETKDTYQVHQVYGWSASGTADETFYSVSESTSRLIPSLIGVEWDPTTAVVAGTAYDCNTDGLANVQVFLHDAAGNIPTGSDQNPFGIFYFSDSDLPTDNDSQPWTNENGLWVAINVPVGEWIVEMWGWDGTQHVKIGATSLDIQAGSVNISNIYTGIEDGIWFPASCLSACG